MTDGTVGPRVRLAGDFEVGADLGTRAGRNLFHSFERFSLATGERATFSGPPAIRNIIGRVTGGARSEIDGTIASTIPGADLYLLNPAGIAFGPNARLDLQGSFHVASAAELRFADGAIFSASDPAASSFTVAAPEAFGFLGPSPAPILVDRSVLEAPAGATLSLTGGDIASAQGVLRAAGGQITLAALGGAGSARVGGGAIDAGRKADIALSDGAVPGVNALRGTVQRASFLGDSVDYRVQVADSDVVLRVAAPAGLRRRAGEAVGLSIDPVACIPLAATEERR